MKHFQRKPHDKNLENTTKNPMISCFRGIIDIIGKFHGNRQTDRQDGQTHRPNEYRNPFSACAWGVKIVINEVYAHLAKSLIIIIANNTIL